MHASQNHIPNDPTSRLVFHLDPLAEAVQSNPLMSHTQSFSAQSSGGPNPDLNQSPLKQFEGLRREETTSSRRTIAPGEFTSLPSPPDTLVQTGELINKTTGKLSRVESFPVVESAAYPVLAYVPLLGQIICKGCRKLQYPVQIQRHWDGPLHNGTKTPIDENVLITEMREAKMVLPMNRPPRYAYMTKPLPHLDLEPGYYCSLHRLAWHSQLKSTLQTHNGHRHLVTEVKGHIWGNGSGFGKGLFPVDTMDGVPGPSITNSLLKDIFDEDNSPNFNSRVPGFADTDLSKIDPYMRVSGFATFIGNTSAVTLKTLVQYAMPGSAANKPLKKALHTEMRDLGRQFQKETEQELLSEILGSAKGYE
jgi:hypothetical protein